MPMKAWKAYSIMAGLTFTTGLFGFLYGKEKLYDYWDAKYLQPKSKISLAIGDNVNFRSDIKITREGKHTGTVELEAPASIMDIQTPSGAAAPPSPKGKPPKSAEPPKPKRPVGSRPPVEPTYIVPGKYQVTGVRYDGGRDPLCRNGLPGWIDVTVASCDEVIAIPCKHYTPDQARVIAKNISEAGVIEVLTGPTGRYQDTKGRHLAVFPMSPIPTLEIDEVEDF